MTEHESNLHDLYAGLAMVGLIINGHVHIKHIPIMAQELADNMLNVRKERADEEETGATDVAVPDMEGREDSDTEGIAALKKTKARNRTV